MRFPISDLYHTYSLVPRPCPAFHRLQYGKVGFFVCVWGEATASIHRQIIYSGSPVLKLKVIPSHILSALLPLKCRTLNFR